MVPSRVAGGMTHSSSSSGIFPREMGSLKLRENSHLTSSFGNSSNSLPGNARSSLGPLSGDVSNTVLNSVASSGPSVGASSLVTDANSGLSGGPNLQRSASINTESYMRLPASPLSFSSNNISVSGSSVMDGSSVAQQSSNQDPNSQQPQHNQQRHGTSSATSLPTSRVGQVQLYNGHGLRVPGSFLQDPVALRLMQYLYHQRQRPPDNSIAYWRKFVAEHIPHGQRKDGACHYTRMLGIIHLACFHSQPWMHGIVIFVAQNQGE
ncbi:hypothetical protein HAX54_039561 [Datura stramonium]|uniref:Uncharacterized protein n=1 Tax=Datura stramonium TaxID=4076 RepID=A0ABS8RN43_DATST|nr:hypothetical protein [Datura stramonium]